MVCFKIDLAQNISKNDFSFNDVRFVAGGSSENYQSHRVLLSSVSDFLHDVFVDHESRSVVLVSLCPSFSIHPSVGRKSKFTTFQSGAFWHQQVFSNQL